MSDQYISESYNKLNVVVPPSREILYSRSPQEKRARWIHDLQQNKDINHSSKNSESAKNGKSGIIWTPGFSQSFCGTTNNVNDSGFHETQGNWLKRANSDFKPKKSTSTFDTFETAHSTFDSDPFESKETKGLQHIMSHRSSKRWAPSGDAESESPPERKLRLGSSLSTYEDEDVEHNHDGYRQSYGNEPNEIEPPAKHPLLRRKGVRYSLGLRPNPKLSSPSESISSESEASQEGCENTLTPSSALLIPNGAPRGRKHSVLFSSYDTWNEDSILQSFRELSASTGKVLEAAWSGDNEKLEALLKDPESLKSIREGNLRDSEGRTPLHLACLNNHKDTVKLLLDTGVNVNEFDRQKFVALSYAASCGSLPLIEILLSYGADVNAGFDFGNTTALHWAVQAGSLECVRKLLEAGALQNPILIFSNTPLHEAATLGDADIVQLLLDYKADTTLCKGPNKSTALHLAAEEGNSACITTLLKAGASHEAKDLRGHTALHIASTCDADAVHALLNGGANPNAVDCNGRTPLHCAVARGSRAAECVRMLVEKGAEIDAPDNFGYTSLHLAAVNESSQCASILLSHGADVTSKTKAGTTALSLLVRKIPDVMQFLVDRLDASVTIHDHEAGDPDCEIRLDFRGIVPNVDKRHSGGQSKEQTYYHQPRKETEYLTVLLGTGNKKILAHPLSEAFLTLKWQRVRKFFWASLLFQMALVALFSIFVIEVYLIKCPYKRHHEQLMDDTTSDEITTTGIPAFEIPAPTINVLGGPKNISPNPVLKRSKRSVGGFNWFSFTPQRHKQVQPKKSKDSGDPIETTTQPPELSKKGKGLLGIESFTPPEIPTEDEDVKVELPCNIGVNLTVIWGLLIGFTSLMAIKEIFQLLQSPMSYVVSSENLGQWALIGSVCLTTYITPGYHLSYWQYPTAAIGIFLAWGLMLLQVGRFPALGMYVQMLGKVAANFGRFILAYSSILIAFALSFSVLFPEYPPYSSVPLALLKVISMMVGEVDYENLFYNDENANDPVIYPITAHILHGAFIIIVTIVLMNLLVGLAVHDIQGLQKGAKINRLSRQTALISRLETFIFSKRLQSCLPKTVGEILLKNALLVPSSYNWAYYFRPNDDRDKRLPRDLKIAALRLAAAKHSSRTSRGNHEFCSRPGSSVKAPSVESQNIIAFRRIEKRIEKLQLQLDLVLKTLVDRAVVSESSNEPKLCCNHTKT